MKRYLLFPLHSVLITLMLLLSTASSAAAEEGETPQIALSVYQASPGATIEVTGGRFEPDIQVTLILVQNGTQILLGTILCDDHGEFLTPLLLPVELQLGQYELRAIDEKNRVAAAPLTVVADESGVEETVPRQDEDPLLAPMPTYAPGVSSTPLPETKSVESPVSSKSSNIIILSIIVGIIALSGIWIYWGRKGKQKS